MTTDDHHHQHTIIRWIQMSYLTQQFIHLAPTIFCMVCEVILKYATLIKTKTSLT